MRFTTWVDLVFRAVGRANAASPLGPGASLAGIGEELGVEGPTWDDFTARTGIAGALMTAMDDLVGLGLVSSENVEWGNRLTPAGRDVGDAGLESFWPEIRGIRVGPSERTFLTRVVEASLMEAEGWADLVHVEADPVYQELGLEADDEYVTDLQRRAFLHDLERKSLIRILDRANGSQRAVRPTYVGVVLVKQSTSAAPAKAGRRRGRPPGPYLIQSREEIARAYRDLWVASGKRPFWTDVALRLGVEVRTLHDARSTLGFDPQAIRLDDETG